MWIYNIEDVFNFGTSIISFPNVNEISTICEDVFDSEICITSNTERLLVSWQKESMCQGGVAYFDSSVDNTVTSEYLLDRSLMIGWRKIWKILKPWKGVLCIHFRVCLSVCVSVCMSVCLHAGYRAHLLTKECNFWVKWSLGHEKKTHFFVFRNFHFYAFYWHFSIFSLYNTSNFLFSSYRS